jgi:hypothetical protein
VLGTSQVKIEGCLSVVAESATNTNYAAALRAEHPGHNSSTEDIPIVVNAGINDTSEYIAGHADDPSYEQVCTG